MCGRSCITVFFPGAKVEELSQGNFFGIARLVFPGDVTVRLADAYGFCWGVERAVQMAYETKKTFPDRCIH